DAAAEGLPEVRVPLRGCAKCGRHRRGSVAPVRVTSALTRRAKRLGKPGATMLRKQGRSWPATGLHHRAIPVSWHADTESGSTAMARTRGRKETPLRATRHRNVAARR